jgi:hypothetical protein
MDFSEGLTAALYEHDEELRTDQTGCSSQRKPLRQRNSGEQHAAGGDEKQSGEHTSKLRLQDAQWTAQMQQKSDGQLTASALAGTVD